MEPVLKRTRAALSRSLLILMFGVAFAAGCGGGGGDGGGTTTTPPSQPTRSFSMGFTPWPYAATLSAVGDTYTKIQAHGDIVTHHVDGGVPWPEAFADDATYHPSVEGELSLRLTNTNPGMPVVLAVAPLNTARNAPADYWDSSTNLPRPTPWDGYDFGDTQLATAYINYLLNLIARFQPDYCNYGIEATEYIRNHSGDATRINNLFNFLQTVYTAVKTAHPNLPLFISATLQKPGSADALLVQGYAAQITACSDILGVSTYGYVFYDDHTGDPANLPVDWLSQAQAYAPGLPLAIAETGWIAEDLDIPFYSNLFVPGSEAWQADYVQTLLAEADRLDVVFVTWFTVVDYDDLWTNALGQDPLAQIWRDTGLYDETVTSRSALTEWDAWLARPKR